MAAGKVTSFSLRPWQALAIILLVSLGARAKDPRQQVRSCGGFFQVQDLLLGAAWPGCTSHAGS